MQIKEVKPINFLFFRTETKISELVNFLPVAKELYKEATAHDLTITGPIHWHYLGFNGDFSKPFTLEISLPVAEVDQIYDGAFHFKRTEPFKCVSMVHEGAWDTIPTAYQELSRFAESKHLQPSAVNRELYINCDFANPEANVTEVQMGVK
ncbi:MAG: GyrI-like domain-containing protein [Chryseolinea sp.]